MPTASSCAEPAAGRLWTIGHSTHPAETLIALLAAAGIEAVADVRRFPASRRLPQFNAAGLARTLAHAGIAYLPFPQLGGRRQARSDSGNLAWKEAGYRGYADYMQTDGYRHARGRLAQAARQRRTAILCAEAAWRSCHRQLIADDFKAAGWEVLHLLADGGCQPHPWSPAARIVDGRLDYGTMPPAQGRLF
ncbi:DUF488 family protein [Pseudoxanthomonas mexicana]|uniref:DUF488 domain-containing protein n=1 Tax=Pseudoxanthomonas mexicana TaxID=128785 RepID=UPI00398AE232